MVRFKFSLMFLAVSLVLSACSQESGVIKIGCSAPLTGDQAKIGTDLCNGVRFAVEEANELGDVLPGLRLKAYVLDDQHNPTQAVNVANRLSADRAVLGVVGHLNSSATKPASAVYHQSRVPQITPASTNPDLSRQGFDTFFRICATDEVQGPVAARFVAKLGLKRIFVVDDKTTYGKGLADQFQKEALKLGLMILGHESLTQGDKDFSPLLTSIRAQDPELIFFGGIYPEASLLIKQARAQGLGAIFFGGDGIADRMLIRLATAKLAEGTYATQIGVDARQLPEAREFVLRYEKRFGELGLYSALAYDAAKLLIEAIRRAGAPERQSVLTSLKKIQKYSGVTGVTSFDAQGDNQMRSITIYKVSNGKFEFVETVR